jgi:hypothetical protein
MNEQQKKSRLRYSGIAFSHPLSLVKLKISLNILDNRLLKFIRSPFMALKNIFLKLLLPGSAITDILVLMA